MMRVVSKYTDKSQKPSGLATLSKCQEASK